MILMMPPRLRAYDAAAIVGHDVFHAAMNHMMPLRFTPRLLRALLRSATPPRVLIRHFSSSRVMLLRHFRFFFFRRQRRRVRADIFPESFAALPRWPAADNIDAVEQAPFDAAFTSCSLQLFVYYYISLYIIITLVTPAAPTSATLYYEFSP